jgi:hypothetical protein
LDEGGIEMTFNTLFLAHDPDANPEKHRCAIETSKYKLYVVIVKDQGQALEMSKQYVKEKEIHSILLCPGFTHKDIAEIAEAVGSNVGISVARGDGPSSQVAMEARKKAGLF